jgi:hypothetical protein
MEPQLAATITARVGEAEFSRGLGEGVTKGVLYTLASLIAGYVVLNLFVNQRKEQEQNSQYNHTGY